DAYLGERPAAFVTLGECAPPTDGEKLCNWANSHLGKHERLQRVEIRNALPKTSIGKLDRKALRREVLGEG
ncbi:MAG TPA: long-chain fatty acid--CoA ligase, partial [Sphingomonadaceae bacterium]|nr:long-chain fatty acid--CoA ligase [Sphingomonadaceae bacterium]